MKTFQNKLSKCARITWRTLYITFLRNFPGKSSFKTILNIVKMPVAFRVKYEFNTFQYKSQLYLWAN